MTPKREAKREYLAHWAIPFVVGAVSGGYLFESFDSHWLIGAAVGAPLMSILWWHTTRASRVMEINIDIDNRNK